MPKINHKVRNTLYAILLLLAAGLSWRFVTRSIFASEKLVLPSGPNDIPYVGFWEWRTITSGLPAEGLQNLAVSGVTDVYIDVSDFLEVPDAKVDAAMRAYIVAANARGMKVHALIGSPLWAKPSHRYLLSWAIKYVSLWNKANPTAQFVGLQADIESYTLPEFQTDATSVMVEYLTAFQGMTKEFAEAQSSGALAPDLEFGTAIPGWFDGTNGLVKTVTFNGKNAQVIDHLTALMDPLKKSRIAIMAYCNVTTNVTCALNLSKRELAVVTPYAPDMKVIVAQDLVENVGNAYKTRITLRARLRAIANQFRPSPAFLGVAVNDANSYERLPKR